MYQIIRFRISFAHEFLGLFILSMCGEFVLQSFITPVFITCKLPNDKFSAIISIITQFALDNFYLMLYWVLLVHYLRYVYAVHGSRLPVIYIHKHIHFQLCYHVDIYTCIHNRNRFCMPYHNDRQNINSYNAFHISAVSRSSAPYSVLFASRRIVKRALLPYKGDDFR